MVGSFFVLIFRILKISAFFREEDWPFIPIAIALIAVLKIVVFM